MYNDYILRVHLVVNFYLHHFLIISESPPFVKCSHDIGYVVYPRFLTLGEIFRHDCK